MTLPKAARQYLYGLAYDIAVGVQGLWPMVQCIEKRWPQYRGYTICQVELFLDTATANKAVQTIKAWALKFDPDEIDRVRLRTAYANLADLERARGRHWVTKFTL
jgi:hypothetical protein